MASYKELKNIADPVVRQRTVERILTLRKQLKEEIPSRTSTDTLLLATWNIREFGENRLEESLYYIAEIIDHYDMVVMQEVNSKKLGGLKKVMQILGENWSYIVSDGVEGTDGGSEAMAFVFNTNKVQFTNMCGEIVLPNSGLIDGVQFARTPFVASFRAGWFDFKLCTVHIYYGSKKNEQGIYERRCNEIAAISKFLLKRAKAEDASYILLGDFNIPDTKGVYFNALSEEKGFFVPEELRKYPSDLGGVSHYDQIAFKLKMDKQMVLFDDDKQKAGAFNFTKSVFRHTDEKSDHMIYKQHYEQEGKYKTDKELQSAFKKWRTFQMSDHMPLWVELKIDFSDQYLKTHVEK